MLATQENINNFITSIRDSISIFANKLAKKEMMGHTDVFCQRQKLAIVTTYLEIVEKYFSITDYSSNNFFTIKEIKEIILRINLLLDTNHYLEIGSSILSDLSDELADKFLFLWTDKYSGDNLLSDLDLTTVITVTNKDWVTTYIPDVTTATFAVPNTATYIAADGSEDFWFDGANNRLQKTLADLIASETLRTFVKYNDFEPYNVYAIGILKSGAVLTEADKVELNEMFKLWVQYWGETMMDTGYMKDDRVLIE